MKITHIITSFISCILISFSSSAIANTHLELEGVELVSSSPVQLKRIECKADADGSKLSDVYSTNHYESIKDNGKAGADKELEILAKDDEGGYYTFCVKCTGEDKTVLEEVPGTCEPVNT